MHISSHIRRNLRVENSFWFSKYIITEWQTRGGVKLEFIRNWFYLTRKFAIRWVLLSCGLQESACGPHGLPTDSLFLTNLRTPIIFFQAVAQLLSCCCPTAVLLLQKLGSLQQQTNIRIPDKKFLKIIRDCIMYHPVLCSLYVDCFAIVKIRYTSIQIK